MSQVEDENKTVPVLKNQQPSHKEEETVRKQFQWHDLSTTEKCGTGCSESTKEWH